LCLVLLVRTWRLGLSQSPLIPDIFGASIRHMRDGERGKIRVEPPFPMPRQPILPRRDQRHVLSLNLLRFGSLLEGGPEACPGSTFRSFSQLEDFYVQGRPFVGPSKIREALQGPVLLSLLQISSRVLSHRVRGGVPIFREGRPELAMLRPSQVEKIAQNRLEAPYRMEFCSLSSTNCPGDATNALHVACQISG